MNQSQHQARAGPTACFNERQKHHSVGLDRDTRMSEYVVA